MQRININFVVIFLFRIRFIVNTSTKRTYCYPNLNNMNTAISLKIKLIALFLFLSLSAFTQNRKYEILGKVDVENGTTSGLKITIFENAKKIKTSTIDKNGKFQYKLDFGNDYMLVFNKEGFVTKKVSISTFVPPEILERDNKFPPFQFNVNLFPAYEGVDLSIFDQPMGMIMYDKELDDFDYDKDYDKQIRDAIRKAEEEARKKAKELAEKNKNKEKAYNDAITKGDLCFKNKKYELAKLAYKDALDVKPKEEYPKNQITKIDKLLAEQAKQLAKQKALDEKYQQIITKADKAFQAEIYTEAKTNYQSALAVKPNENYPKNQIKKIEEILADKAKQLAEEEALEEKYQKLITKADNEFKTENYTEAKTNYLSALEIKPNGNYPKEQIKKIEKILTDKAKQLAEQKALENKYRQLITTADKEFKAENYTEAKTNYQSALEIKPTKDYPKEQIKKIEEILADKAKQLAEQKALNKKYQQIIAKADKEFQTENYTDAKTDYQSALEIKPNEEYPLNQIKKIDNILDNKAKQLAEQKALDEKYNKIIAKADKKFQTEDYTDAKTNYQSALEIKPNENYPKEQIKKIEAILSKQAKEKALEEKYQQLITKADKEFKSDNYIAAKTNYQSALEIKPNEKYPLNQIKKIEEILAEQKRKEQLALEKKNIEDNYNAIIKKADELFNTENYNDAKTAYNDALKIFSNKKYPKKQIAKIEIILAKKLRKEARNKEIQKRYDLLIKKADEYYEKEIHKTATARYKMALKLKPEENYPKQQIAKIEAFFKEQQELNKRYKALIKDADKLYAKKNYDMAKTTYQKALVTKPSEEYPRDMIAKIDLFKIDEMHKYAEFKVQNKRYNDLLVIADKQFNDKEYERAKASYNKMLEIKPKEKYPQQQIAKIDAIFAERQRKTEEAEQLAKEQKERAEKYRMLIANGDRLFKDKSWQPSIGYYEKAAVIKPEESYPKEQIEKAKAELQKITDREREQQENEQKYNELIALGDKNFNTEKYQEAQKNYREALKIKDKNYPKEQLRRIAIILQKIESEKENQRKLQEQYETQIAKGDEFFNDEEFGAARHHYQQAIEIKPEEEYPKEKLQEIAELLAKAEKVNKTVTNNTNNTDKKTSIREEKLYAELIEKGDKNFKAEHYTVAKVMYNRALKLFQRDYPKQQLEEIARLVREGKIALLTEAYEEAIAKGDDALNNKEYGVAKFYYKKAMAIAKEEDYPRQQLQEITNIIDEKKAYHRKKAYEKAINKADKALAEGDKSMARFYYKKALRLQPKADYPAKQLNELNEN